jgi:hypothetical protein
MKTVLILTNPAPAGLYLLSKFKMKDITAYSIIESQPIYDTILRTIRRKGDPILSRLNKLVFYSYYALFLKRSIDRYQFENLKIANPSCANMKVNSINSDEALHFAEELAPDFILTNGTSILGNKWLSLGIPIINLHYGMIPKYRGRFCWFWPIVKNDFKSVGISYHLVTQRVDAGKTIIQASLSGTSLGGLEIGEILVELTRLAVDNISNLLEMASHLDTRNDEQNNKLLYTAYLEPGITDYFLFVRNRKSYLRVGKS